MSAIQLNRPNRELVARQKLALYPAVRWLVWNMARHPRLGQGIALGGELAEQRLASQQEKCPLEVQAEVHQLPLRGDLCEMEEHSRQLDHRHPEEVGLRLFLPEAPRVVHLYRQAALFGPVEDTDWSPKLHLEPLRVREEPAVETASVDARRDKLRRNGR